MGSRNSKFSGDQQFQANLGAGDSLAIALIRPTLRVLRVVHLAGGNHLALAVKGHDEKLADIAVLEAPAHPKAASSDRQVMAESVISTDGEADIAPHG